MIFCIWSCVAENYWKSRVPNEEGCRVVGLRAAKLFKKDVRLGCMGLRGKRPVERR
jgi:uncharacterized radical SAM superfamily protein